MEDSIGKAGKEEEIFPTLYLGRFKGKNEGKHQFFIFN